jgi:hypothetical protein
VSIARVARPFILILALPAVALIAPGAQASAPSTPASLPGAAAAQPGGPASVPATPVSAPSGGPVVTNGAAMATYSRNWAGYVTAGRHYRYVAATFTVPRLDCAKTPGNGTSPTLMSDWVGLDGTGSPATVEQDGVTAECNGHNAEYGAWYEMYPKSPVYPAISVGSGDTIRASVYHDAGQNDYQLVVSDLSRDESFTRWEKCGAGSCADSSAEVITESPGKTTGGFYPLADFGTTSFSGISITDGAGQHGPFTSAHWQSGKFVMTDDSHQTKAAVGGLGQNGHAFSVYWERES